MRAHCASGKAFPSEYLVPELSDSYSAMVLAGVEEALIEEGYFYLTASHRRKPDLIEEYPRMFMERSVEGLILIDTVLQHRFKIPGGRGCRASRDSRDYQRGP